MPVGAVPVFELRPQCFCKHHEITESACNIKFLHQNLLCSFRASHKDIKHSYKKQQSSRNYTTMTLFRQQSSENLFKMFDVVKYVNDIQLLGDKKLHELVKTLQSAAFESARSAVFFIMITYLYCLHAKKWVSMQVTSLLNTSWPTVPINWYLLQGWLTSSQSLQPFNYILPD